MPNLMMRALRGAYELVEVFVLSASVFFVIYLFLGQPHQVKGSSMEPSFHNAEYLITDKVTYRTRTPAYGDIVVFKAPMNENYDFIKRVIAVAGQKIMVKEGHIYINGSMLDESHYLSNDVITLPGSYLREGVEFTVPEGMVMAMGDNRSHSSDSREWGPVPLQNIVGKTFFRYWPPTRMGVI